MTPSATDTVQTRVAPQQRKPLVALVTEAALLITAAYDSSSGRKWRSPAFTLLI